MAADQFTQSAEPPVVTEKTATDRGKPAKPPIAGELQAVVQKAQDGDASVLPRLREILDHHPEIWQHVGNLSTLVEHAWIAVLAADNPLAVESMRRTIAEKRADLAGEHPTPQERLLVDHVVACWLEAKHMERESADAGYSSLNERKFRLKQLESAHRRFDNAMKLLNTTHSLMPAGLVPPQSDKVDQPKGDVG